MDLPGFGDEPVIETGYETCINELAQKVKSTYPKLPVVILGHSMGGAVATCLANEINPILLLVIDTSLFASAASITCVRIIALPIFMLDSPSRKSI
jgi:alpha-beta hydrolase superfamily lysophospholipase